MREFFLVWLLGVSIGVWAQNSSGPPGTPPAKNQSPDSSPSSMPSSSASAKSQDLSPPRSDRVNVDELGDQPGESSSKETRIDLSPPADDAKFHPHSSDAVTNAETLSGDADVNEFHPWDPHRAAKDVEVGDFYFKRKNYRAAEDRYREALFYKDNDAAATYRLAVCLEKMGRPDESIKEFESYLKILPNGPEAEHSKKALDRLKANAASASPTK